MLPGVAVNNGPTITLLHGTHARHQKCGDGIMHDTNHEPPLWMQHDSIHPQQSTSEGGVITSRCVTLSITVRKDCQLSTPPGGPWLMAK